MFVILTREHQQIAVNKPSGFIFLIGCYVTSLVPLDFLKNFSALCQADIYLYINMNEELYYIEDTIFKRI